MDIHNFFNCRGDASPVKKELTRAEIRTFFGGSQSSSNAAVIPDSPTEQKETTGFDIRTFFGGSHSSSNAAPTELTPVEAGFSLEACIHLAVSHFPSLTHCKREQDIRAHFSDPSMNGVDHWIQFDKTHILIQDKWKESITQQEVSQFLTCADRIHARLPTDSHVYLIWACKREPTSHSRKLLEERGVSILSCAINIESLARLVILQVAECCDIECTKALQSIRSLSKPTPLAPSKRDVIVVGGGSAGATTATESFDESEEGKAAIEDMKRTIRTIHTVIFPKINMARHSACPIELDEVYRTIEIRNLEDWWSGKHSKFDFAGFMKTAKNICWATKKKKTQITSMFVYCKLRKITTEFAKYATEYETKRKALLVKRSVLAKNLPMLKVNAEPITQAEYVSAACNCEGAFVIDYQACIASSRATLKPAYGNDFGFYSCCNV